MKRRLKIYRADYNFRAIPLKAGEHEIKFIYSPISFKIGMLVSLLTLIGIAVYFIGRPRLPAGRQEDRPYKKHLRNRCLFN